MWESQNNNLHKKTLRNEVFFYFYCWVSGLIFTLAFAQNPRIVEIRNKIVGMLPIINAINVSIVKLDSLKTAYNPQTKGIKNDNVAINIKIAPTLALTK